MQEELLGTDIIEYRTKACILCGERSTVRARWHQFVAWGKGMLIQDAFPELSDDERELLKTGTHPECWNILFPDEEDCGD
jgi:hypothetical protein